MKRLPIIMACLLAPAAACAQALPIGSYDQTADEPNGTEIAMRDEQHGPVRAIPRAVRHGERTLLLIDDAPPAAAGIAVGRRPQRAADQR